MFFEVKNIQKLFDNDNGVKDINFSIEEGEFVTILGPSGCGKTTILNLIGGFIRQDSGEILLNGENVEHLYPEDRPFSTVFQNYALFSNYNVIDNVMYGIKYFRKIKGKKVREMAMDYLSMVGLKEHAEKPITQLSGGQQQRVALARGLATNPKMLLLDEPLSNLDAKLRVDMREEIKTLQEKYHLSMLFVTHDQEEALYMSDKIIVMDKGNIVQIGTPKEVYLHPKNRYVASFLGESNFIEEDGELYLIRPEDIAIDKDGEDAEIKTVAFLGDTKDMLLDYKGRELNVKVIGNTVDYSIGESVGVTILRRSKIA